MQQFLPTATQNSRIGQLRSQLLSVCDSSMIYPYPFPIISGQLPDYLLTRRVKAARSNCYIIAVYTADAVLNDDFCGFTTGNAANAQRLLVPRTLLLSFQ